MEKKKAMGNKSREAVSWIGGPQHEVKPQHIPGYKGHIRGYNSENVYGTSFSKGSSKCIRD